jgi:AcrR family transcriptional regulator
MKYNPQMDKRRYVQRRRAESAQQTRERILEAARASLRSGPLGAVKVDDIAREAGVARSTLYVLFGSRPGLLEAMADDLLEHAGFDRLVKAFRLPDARTALLESLRAGTEAYATDADLARSLLTLAATDPDAVGAVRRFERGRWPGMRNLAGRLEAQGYLRQDLLRVEAAQILWVLTSFPTFDQLYRERGLNAAGVTDRLRAMAERTLLRAPAPDAP